jgi:hypothetical protein
MEVRAGWLCRFPVGLGAGFVESAKQPVEVNAGEAPVERHGGPLVAALEAEQPLLDLGEVQEVVGVRTLRCTMEK